MIGPEVEVVVVEVVKVEPLVNIPEEVVVVVVVVVVTGRSIEASYPCVTATKLGTTRLMSGGSVSIMPTLGQPQSRTAGGGKGAS